MCRTSNRLCPLLLAPSTLPLSLPSPSSSPLSLPFFFPSPPPSPSQLRPGQTVRSLKWNNDFHLRKEWILWIRFEFIRYFCIAFLYAFYYLISLIDFLQLQNKPAYPGIRANWKSKLPLTAPMYPIIS